MKITFASSQDGFKPGSRIHDFIKGWGTINETGDDIIWDTWRDLTPEELAAIPPINFDKIITPPVYNLDIDKYNYDIRQVFIDAPYPVVKLLGL